METTCYSIEGKWLREHCILDASVGLDSFGDNLESFTMPWHGVVVRGPLVVFASRGCGQPLVSWQQLCQALAQLPQMPQHQSAAGAGHSGAIIQQLQIHSSGHCQNFPLATPFILTLVGLCLWNTRLGSAVACATVLACTTPNKST